MSKEHTEGEKQSRKAKNEIKLFDSRKIRTAWDAETEEWFFSVVDVIAALTEQSDLQGARNYWKVLKHRLKNEGNETVTNCNRLKMPAADGKMRVTDAGTAKDILRLIQSIPSKKAEPFKLWLAEVGNDRINEAQDPELSIDRAIKNYRRLGYSEDWINQRIKTIEVRKALTDEWDKSGVKEGSEYAILTDLMTKTWSGMSTKIYKQYKNLKKENLRDNMTNVELILNMLAEASATEISKSENPQDYEKSKEIAQSGASVAKNAKEDIERRTGKPAVSNRNAKELGKRKNGLIEG